MFTDAERRYLDSTRVARLATADADGRPNAVPVCFALVGGERGRSSGERTNAKHDDTGKRDGTGEPDTEADPWIASPIDEKPKDASADALRRVRDVRENPRVALVADRYVEDWDRLGWVQVRGTAAVLEPGDGGHSAAVAALRAEYDQYADHALEERPALRIDPGHVRSWGWIVDPPG